MKPEDEAKIYKTLASIGLSKSKIKIYLDLLRFPSSSVMNISKRTNIHRTNIYDSLNDLEAKNLIIKDLNGKSATYSALRPEEILKYIKNAQRDLKDIIPYLENITIEDHSKKEVATMSYGLPGLRKSFKTMMENKNDIKIFNAPTNIIDILGKDFLKDFHRWRSSNKLSLKVIYSQYCERVDIAKKYLHSFVKVFPGKNESLCPYVLSGNRVFFLMLTEPPTIVEINDKNIAKTFDKNFEFIWSKLK